MQAPSYLARSAYIQVRTETASQEEKVVILFEGMVRLLSEARGFMQERSLEQQSERIGRVQRILTELTCAVDGSVDEALATALRCTYVGMYNRLAEANVRDDLEALDEVAALTARLTDAWRTALQYAQGATEEAVAAAG